MTLKHNYGKHILKKTLCESESSWWLDFLSQDVQKRIKSLQQRGLRQRRKRVATNA